MLGEPIDAVLCNSNWTEIWIAGTIQPYTGHVPAQRLNRWTWKYSTRMRRHLFSFVICKLLQQWRKKCWKITLLAVPRQSLLLLKEIANGSDLWLNLSAISFPRSLKKSKFTLIAQLDGLGRSLVLTLFAVDIFLHQRISALFIFWFCFRLDKGRLGQTMRRAPPHLKSV